MSFSNSSDFSKGRVYLGDGGCIFYFIFSGELSDVGQGGGGGEDQAEAGEEHGERQQINF